MAKQFILINSGASVLSEFQSRSGRQLTPISLCTNAGWTQARGRMAKTMVELNTPATPGLAGSDSVDPPEGTATNGCTSRSRRHFLIESIAKKNPVACKADPLVSSESGLAVGPTQIAGSGESAQPPEQPFSAFGSLKSFEQAKRMATLLAHSSIVPANFRGEAHIGDCVIALELANRTGASVLAVMQNLRMVQGNPGWSAAFLVACVNSSKRFTPIRYRMTGTPGEDNWGCIAWVLDNSGALLESPEVTIATAKAETWYYRPYSMWRSMPELMLRYRSAALFARLYAPESAMGIQTTEELLDMNGDLNGQPTRPVFDGTVTGSRSEPVARQNKDEIPANSSPAAPTVGQSEGKSEKPASSAAQTAATAEQPGAIPKQYNYLRALTGLLRLSKHSENDLLKFLRNTHRCEEPSSSLAEVFDKTPDAVQWAHDNWQSVDQELARRKKGRGV